MQATLILGLKRMSALHDCDTGTARMNAGAVAWPLY